MLETFDFEVQGTINVAIGYRDNIYNVKIFAKKFLEPLIVPGNILFIEYILLFFFLDNFVQKSIIIKYYYNFIQKSIIYNFLRADW